MTAVLLRNHFNRYGVAKVGFDNEADAHIAADRAQFTHGSKRRPYRAYQCSDCHKWHIGRRPARQAKRKKKLK